MDPTTIPSFDSSVTATAKSLQASGAYLDYVEVHNPNAVQVYLQLFDSLVGDVTVGTTAPTMALAIPPGTGADVGIHSEMFNHPPQFRTGLSYAVTTTATGNTAAGAACAVNFVRH